MPHATHSRRQFLQTSLAAGAAATITPYWLTSSTAQAQTVASTDRHAVGFIGTGDRLPGR